MEGKIYKLVVALGRNVCRLQDSSELCLLVREELEKLYEENRRNDGKQPFIVDDIIFDVYSGVVAIYYHDNDYSDLKSLK